jgi:heat shock protein HslJ
MKMKIFFYRTINFIFISIFFITFIGCKTLLHRISNQSFDPEVNLENTTWILSTLNQNKIEVDAEHPIKIKINNNNFKGFAGCNQFWGICKINQSQIAFSNINRTKMSCDKIKTENLLVEILRESTAYVIYKKNMKLINQKAEVLAEFQALDEK